MLSKDLSERVAGAFVDAYEDAMKRAQLDPQVRLKIHRIAVVLLPKKLKVNDPS